MSEPHELRELQAAAAEEHVYGFDQASRILAAVDFLRGGGTNKHRRNRHDNWCNPQDSRHDVRLHSS